MLTNEMPITQESAELALEILKTAMRYNRTSTTKEETGDKPTFSVEFTGLVCQLSVRIHPHGWERGDECERYSYTIDLAADEYTTVNQIVWRLNQVLEKMHEVYRAWEES